MEDVTLFLMTVATCEAEAVMVVVLITIGVAMEVVASTEAAMEEGKEVMGSMASADEVEVVPEILAGEVAAEWAEEEDGYVI